jgi:hypothetical protein
MGDLAIDDRTAVVLVDHVLTAPDPFKTLEGQRITLQLAADTDPPEVNQQFTFFAQGLAFGESVALAEVGRLPVEDIEGRMTEAFEAGVSQPFADIEQQIKADELRRHADEADVVVVGRVVKLEKVLQPAASEHDEDWWCATIAVFHVEKGSVDGDEVRVLYANSLDVRWRSAPKPKASQGGLWLLHATEDDLREAAPFKILHSEDFQPLQELDSIRADEPVT